MKPEHYKVVSISLYIEDIELLEKLTKESKRNGDTKANKSQIIRRALKNFNPEHRNTMTDEHTHDDCVQCLQKEVRRLQAALDAEKEAVSDITFELAGRERQTRTSIIAYLEQLDAAQTENTKEQDGARFAIRTALGKIRAEQDESSCVHCGYSLGRHSSIGICPHYDAAYTRFTP